MRLTSFQQPELRDEDDEVIQEGAYSKKNPLCNVQNNGILDYINNNLVVHQNEIESLKSRIEALEAGR